MEFVIIYFSIAFIVAPAVAIDASDRGMNPLGWGIGVFALMIVFLPWYLIVRKPRIEEKTSKPLPAAKKEKKASKPLPAAKKEKKASKPLPAAKKEKKASKPLPAAKKDTKRQSVQAKRCPNGCAMLIERKGYLRCRQCDWIEIPKTSASDKKNIRKEEKHQADYCPNGCGMLRDWEGQPRCWICGWTDTSNFARSPVLPESKTSYSGRRLKTGILMGLTHTRSQRNAVIAAVEEFVGSHSQYIMGSPGLTWTSDGSIIEITIMVKNDEEGMRLHNNLQICLIARGINWY